MVGTRHSEERSMREHNPNRLGIQSQHYLHERRIERTRNGLGEVVGGLAQRPIEPSNWARGAVDPPIFSRTTFQSTWGWSTLANTWRSGWPEVTK
jgi:hypothetical protein